MVLNSAAQEVLNAIFVLESLGLASGMQYNASTAIFVDCLTARGSASHFTFRINNYQQDTSLPSTSASASARLLRTRRLLLGSPAQPVVAHAPQMFSGYTLPGSNTPMQYGTLYPQVGMVGCQVLSVVTIVVHMESSIVHMESSVVHMDPA